MADDFTEFPIFIISLVAGAAVVVSFFISKLVRRVSIPRVSVTDAQEKAKISESLSNGSKKSRQSQLNKTSIKKKHGDKCGRDAKQSFNHQWLLTSLKGHSSSILDMDFSPNGKYLATCGEDRVVFIWNTKDWDSKDHKNFRINVPYDHATLVRWSPDSKAFMIKKAAENVVEVYRVNKKNGGWINAATKILTYSKHYNDEIIGLGVASNGKYVMTCSEKTDLIISDLKGAIFARIDTYLMNTYFACVSPCGKYISACGFAPEARVWEVQFTKTGDFKQVVRAFDLQGHTSRIFQVAFNSDTTKMATISEDGSWRLFNINVELDKGEDPKVIATGKYKQEEEGSCLALSPMGDVVAVSSGSTLSLFFADTGEIDATITGIFLGPITCILFDSGGKYVLVSGERHVRVFHNVTGYKAIVKTARAKLTQPNNSSAMKERLKEQIAYAEALVSNFCPLQNLFT